MHYFRAFIVVALTCVFTVGTALAERRNVVPGDYDADGRSDIVVTRKVDGLWHWFFRLATGEQLGPVAFGLAPTENADTLLPGDLDGDGDFNLNVVRDINGFLYWYTPLNDASIQETIWGRTGDRPHIGFFGGTPGHNRVAIRDVAGGLIWYIEGVAPNGISWGFSDDEPYSADVTGDGIDELIVRREQGGFHVWIVRDIAGNFVQTFIWGLDSDAPLHPSDFNGDGKADFAVTRAQNGFKDVFLRYSDLNGATQAVSLGLEDDTPYVGNFTQANLSELAVKRSADGFTSHFVRFAQDGNVVNVIFGLDTDTVVAPEGGALENPTLAAASFCTPTPGTPTDFVDGARGGALWKPVSEGVPNHAPVILLPLNYAGSPLVIYGSNGQVVSGIQRTLWGGHNGNRAHFWLTNTARQLAQFAPLTVQIFNDGQVECRIVPNPQQRYD